MKIQITTEAENTNQAHKTPHSYIFHMITKIKTQPLEKKYIHFLSSQQLDLLFASIFNTFILKAEYPTVSFIW